MAAEGEEVNTPSLHRGDCLAILPTLPTESVDACVTDPPYDLTAKKKCGSGPKSDNPNSPAGRARITTGFMGKSWDGTGIAFNPATWREVYRVLKPGAYLVAFGGTRTYHRMVCAIEDAGFEIRDQLAWVYGSGFPKSHNLDGEHEGWGTALKPAWEPIVLARKPMIATVAKNVDMHGTGAINIADCRVGDETRTYSGTGAQPNKLTNHGKGDTGIGYMDGSGRDKQFTVNGRWPANLCHDGSEEVLSCFPLAPGALAPVKGTEPSAAADGTRCFNAFARTANSVPRIESEESAARFFYCAKASRADRDAGLDQHFPKKPLNLSSGTQNPGSFQSKGTDKSPRNFHPTVKPTALMRWLCRLVTPPRGTILDPMMGSGSTGRGAVLGGFSFIGIEKEAEYLAIAEARINEAVGPLFSI